MSGILKYIIRTLVLILGFFSAVTCLIIVLISTRTVFLTILSGAALIYIIYATYAVVKDFLDF